MKNHLFVLMSLAFLASACSITTQVERSASSQRASMINKSIQDNRVDVYLRNQRLIKGTAIAFDRSELTISLDSDGSVRRIPVDSIVTIRQNPRALPTIGGLLLGGGVGLVIGSKLAAESTKPDPMVFGFNSVGDAIAGGATGALLGGAVGAVVGSVAGSVVDYEFYSAHASATAVDFNTKTGSPADKHR